MVLPTVDLLEYLIWKRLKCSDDPIVIETSAILDECILDKMELDTQ